jgi:glycosyltransferase involved in cell wall biosynthesis
MLITDGALAGLSLLQDDPNLRHSMPTKVAEYMARGVPVITTPLPLAADLVERSGCGFIVPFGDPKAAAEAVRALQQDPALRDLMGARGHQDAVQFLRWPEDARAFVAQLERWAGVSSLPDGVAVAGTGTPAAVSSPVSGPDDR